MGSFEEARAAFAQEVKLAVAGLRFLSKPKYKTVYRSSGKKGGVLLVTIPKKWEEELGLKHGSVVKCYLVLVKVGRSSRLAMLVEPAGRKANK